MYCVVCLFKDHGVTRKAETILNGNSLCMDHAIKVMNRDDQMQGLVRWMVETEDAGRW